MSVDTGAPNCFMAPIPIHVDAMADRWPILDTDRHHSFMLSQLLAVYYAKSPEDMIAFRESTAESDPSVQSLLFAQRRQCNPCDVPRSVSTSSQRHMIITTDTTSYLFHSHVGSIIPIPVPISRKHTLTRSGALVWISDGLAQAIVFDKRSMLWAMASVYMPIDGETSVIQPDSVDPSAAMITSSNGRVFKVGIRE